MLASFPDRRGFTVCVVAWIRWSKSTYGTGRGSLVTCRLLVSRDKDGDEPRVKASQLLPVTHRAFLHACMHACGRIGKIRIYFGLVLVLCYPRALAELVTVYDQVRRYVYHDVVRLDDLERLIDCSFVQVTTLHLLAKLAKSLKRY